MLALKYISLTIFWYSSSSYASKFWGDSVIKTVKRKIAFWYGQIYSQVGLTSVRWKLFSCFVLQFYSKALPAARTHQRRMAEKPVLNLKGVDELRVMCRKMGKPQWKCSQCSWCNNRDSNSETPKCKSNALDARLSWWYQLRVCHITKSSTNISASLSVFPLPTCTAVLGAFRLVAKRAYYLRYVRLLVSLAVRVHQSGSHWTDLDEIWHWGLLCKSA